MITIIITLMICITIMACVMMFTDALKVKYEVELENTLLMHELIDSCEDKEDDEEC